MGELPGNASPSAIRTLDYGLQYHNGADIQKNIYKQGSQMTSVITSAPEQSSPLSAPNAPSTQPLPKMAAHPLQVQILPSLSMPSSIGSNQVSAGQLYPGHRVCIHQQQGSPLTPLPSSVSAKRPSNSWILYRKEKHPQVLAQNPDISNNEISKIVAKMWKNEPESVKDKYKLQAQIERNMHKQLYPDYKYAPRKNKVRRHRWATSKNNAAPAATQQLPVQNAHPPPESKPHQHIMVSQWQNPTPPQVPRAICQQPAQNSPQNYQIHKHDGFNELDYLFNAYRSPVAPETLMRPMQQPMNHPPQAKGYFYIPQQYIHQQNQAPTPISPHPEKSFLSPPRYGQEDLIPTPTSAQPELAPQNTQMFQFYSQNQDVSSKDCHALPQQHLSPPPNPPNFLQQQ